MPAASSRIPTLDATERESQQAMRDVSAGLGSVPAAHCVFVNNMRPLWRLDPQLAYRIDAVHDEERLLVEQTRSGHWTVRGTVDNPPESPLGKGGGINPLGKGGGINLLGKGGGKNPLGKGGINPLGEGKLGAYVHSRVDPVAEGKRWAEAIDLDDKYCFVISGFGLGYHVRALFERLRGDAFILCLEPDVRMLATALAHVDLAEMLASNRVLIITDPDKGRLHRRLQPVSTLMMLGAEFLRHAASVRLDPDGHTALHAAVNEFVTFTRTSLMTLVKNARITCKNVAMNLVHYVTTPPIDLLKDRFAGHPAIVISAGPSLSRNIEQLAELKGKAVLCAVQTALRPLLQRGIVPDFATSLDYHEISRKFFEQVGDLSQTHLVAEPKATWHVLDQYPGPMSLLHNSWAQLVLGDELAARDGLPAGATVAHLAFYLAVYLGCDPIIFVGQDLAFTGHVYYTPGVEIHRAWQSEINRFCTMEQKEWERIARHRAILRRVPGNNGETWYTDELLLTYLEQFEKDIAATNREVINATEGGARIRGAQPLALRDAVARHCARAIDPAKSEYRATTRWRDESSLPRAIAQVESRIAEMDDCVALCDELLVRLAELDGLVHDPATFNRKLIRIDELRTKVQQSSRAYAIVNAATQLVELRRYSADRRISSEQTGDAERARRQIARDIAFITGVREGAKDMKPELAAAAERMRDTSNARGQA